MFFAFINKKTSNKHKLLFLSNLSLLFYQPLTFFGKTFFLRNYILIQHKGKVLHD